MAGGDPLKPMKKIAEFCLALSLILSFVSASVAETKPQPRFSITLSAGGSLPLGYLADKYPIGGNVGIEISYRFLKRLSLFAMFHHSYFTWNAKDLDTEVISHEGGEFGCYNYFGGLKASLPVSSRLTMSGLAGVGIGVQESGRFYFKTRQPGPGGGWIETETITYNILPPGTFFAVVVGAGLEYDLSRRFALFVAPRLIVVFDTERTPPPEWAWLDPSVYRDPPGVVFLPLMIGISFKI